MVYGCCSWLAVIETLLFKYVDKDARLYTVSMTVLFMWNCSVKNKELKLELQFKPQLLSSLCDYGIVAFGKL